MIGAATGRIRVDPDQLVADYGQVSLISDRGRHRGAARTALRTLEARADATQLA